MVEPEKPFACTLPDCGMTFTNEDHLHVHTKKHDMVLQLGLEQKAAFVADQTPTPTRFIRNCEEVGLFQDLQNVNPFDEGFKRAMETKTGILSLEGAIASSSDDLHTPQMVFPLLDAGDSTLFSTTNNQRNITISRSSSDESGAIKEYETTTISKLTNEVTTISRIVGKQDIVDKITGNEDLLVKHAEVAQNKDIVNETSVSYTNNVIKIHSNVEIRKDGSVVNIDNTKNLPVTLISYTDSVIKDATSVVTKDVLLTDASKSQNDVKAPVTSQKSIEFAVDSPVCDLTQDEVTCDKDQLINMLKRNYHNTLNKPDSSKTKAGNKSNSLLKKQYKKSNETKDTNDDYEVIIKLPNGKQVRMKAVEEADSCDKTQLIQDETKKKLKRVLTNKVDKKMLESPLLKRLPSLENTHQVVPNILPIQTGTLYPVTIVNPGTNPIIVTNTLPKIPIPQLNTMKIGVNNRKPAKRRISRSKFDKKQDGSPIIVIDNTEKSITLDNIQSTSNDLSTNQVDIDKDKNVNDEDCIIIDSQIRNKNEDISFSNDSLERRSAASKRYRERLKESMRRQHEENRHLKERNQRLMEENVALKLSITEHLKTCPNASDLIKVANKRTAHLD